MKTSVKYLFLASIFLLATSFTLSETSVAKWVKLGSKKVSYKLDRDVLRVGAQDGRFTKLKIEVTGGKVNMHKMIVEYGNGTKDNIPLRHSFDRKSGSRVIDLEGYKRVIKDITFFYDTKNRSRNKATVHVFGKH